MTFPVTLDVYAAYVVATTILLLIPGPTIMLVVSYALARGPKAAAATVAGVGLGDFTAMSLSFLGLGALLAASAEWFVILKWVGAAYLVWLGIKMWRAPPVLEEVDADATRRDGRRMMIHCWIVTALNPRGSSSSSRLCRSSWTQRGRRCPSSWSLAPPSWCSLS